MASAFRSQMLSGLKAFTDDPSGVLDQLETSVMQRRQEFRRINAELLQETVANLDDLGRGDFEGVNQRIGRRVGRVRRRAERVFSGLGQRLDQWGDHIADRFSEQFIIVTPEREAALAVMGLRPTAGPEEIKRRYRSLAKLYHPDKGGDHRKMATINAAYRLLMED